MFGMRPTIALNNVDLPHPVGPARTVISFDLILKLISSNILSSLELYLNEKLLNLINSFTDIDSDKF